MEDSWQHEVHEGHEILSILMQANFGLGQTGINSH